MKFLFSLLALSGLFLSQKPCVEEVLPGGRYLEARTASVFAGACHYGGEYTTGGREAVMAWKFETGSALGVELEGLTMAAVVTSKVNLAEGKKHRSVLFFPRATTEAQENALRKVVLESEPALFGEIVEVRRVDLDLELVKDTYSLRIDKALTLEGELMPDRACCHMPSNVWYQPLCDAATKPIVGCSETFRVDVKKLVPCFERNGDNDAFVGAFAYAPKAQPATCCAK